MSDIKFRVKAGDGKVLGEFDTYSEAFTTWRVLYRHDKAVVIQDVRAAQ